MIHRLRHIFTLSPVGFSRYELFMLILLAYSFAVGVKYYPLIDIYEDKQALYEGSPIIKSPDGFYFAQGARDRIAGDYSHTQSPVDSSVSILTETIYHITPFSFEQILYFMPVFFSSLVVIPLILIGKELKNPLVGFSSALLLVVSTAYFSRTAAGYYDDDFLTLTFPFWLLYFMIASANYQKSISESLKSIILNPITLGILTILIYHWWYKNGPILITGFLGFMLVFTLLFDRRNRNSWMFIILGIIANLKLALWIKLPFVMLMYGGWLYIINKRADKEKLFYISLVFIALILLGFSGLFGQLIAQFDSYISKDGASMVSDSSRYGLNYFNSLQTVSESIGIGYAEFYSRMSWEKWIFLSGSVGYVIMALRYRYLWFAFPLYVIGLSAVDAGSRFIPYGAPVVFLGLSYLVYLIVDKLSSIYKLKFIYPKLGVLALLYPLSYALPLLEEKNNNGSMTPAEAHMLSYLGEVSSSDDYIVSWWDYGYPARYYSGLKTHSDGGSQNGNLTYMESLALSAPSQALGANLLREVIEIKEEGLSGEGSFGAVMEHGNMGETRKSMRMIEKLSTPTYQPHEKSVDIYWMMNFRMLQIYPTIRAFSEYDLQSMNYLFRGFYYFTQSIKDKDSTIEFGNGITFHKNSALLTLANGSTIKVRQLINVKYIDEKVATKVNPAYSNDGRATIINIEDLDSYVIVDDTVLNSNFVQMYILGNYNKEYFEEVISSPIMKVFRVKR
ncbi:MAG: STT3 domain-containing protein [Campylobacterales bacterium]